MFATTKNVPGVLGSFVHIDGAVDAIRGLRARGHRDLTVYTAAPNHEIEEALEHSVSLSRKPVREAAASPQRPAADPAEPSEVGDADRARLIEALGPAPVDVDELGRATGLSARAIQIALMELALAGRIERHGHQLVSLKR